MSVPLSVCLSALTSYDNDIYIYIIIIAATPLEASRGYFPRPMRSYPVKENPIGSAVSEILRYRYTDKHTSCYFIVRIWLYKKIIIYRIIIFSFLQILNLKNFKIKTSFVSSDWSKALANKTYFNFRIILFYYSWRTVCNTLLYIIFQYGLEPVLIQGIIIETRE